MKLKCVNYNIFLKKRDFCQRKAFLKLENIHNFDTHFHPLFFVKLCFSSPKITHLFRQFRPPTEDFLSNVPTQPPHSRGMRIFSHPQSAQFSYVGETGRAFGTRLKEKMKDAEKVNSMRYTRASRKDSVEEVHKSAVTDHIAEQNHVIDWEKDSNKQTRWIREAIWIRKRGAKVLNRDEGVYCLSHVYDKLLEQQRTVHSVDGKNTHPSGVRRLSRRITEEVFRRRTKLSKQVSNFWTWKT